MSFIRLRVQRRTVLGDRVLEVGDVLDINTATHELFVAASLPFNATALRELLAAGDAHPVDLARADAFAMLGGREPAPTGAGRRALWLVKEGAEP